IHTFSLLLRRPHTSPVFPYTTLFRSLEACAAPRQDDRDAGERDSRLEAQGAERLQGGALGERHAGRARHGRLAGRQEGLPRNARSEEHTSELQSRENLVCRLLLEKKK